MMSMAGIAIATKINKSKIKLITLATLAQNKNLALLEYLKRMG
jgi:hypothetical protein